MPTTKIQRQTPLGLALPIRNNGVGFFEQTIDTFTRTKTNIINLLNTSPGERRMQPLFGCRLHRAVFEQNTEILPEYISNIIKEDIGRWIPNVVVNKVEIKMLQNEKYENTDIYKVYVAMNFTVTTTNQSDTIELVVDSNKI